MFEQWLVMSADSVTRDGHNFCIEQVVRFPSFKVIRKADTLRRSFPGWAGTVIELAAVDLG